MKRGQKISLKTDRFGVYNPDYKKRLSIFLKQGSYYINREIEGLGYLIYTGNPNNEEEVSVIRYENAI